MKQSPFEKDLTLNLNPSKFSAQGFLGTDTRPVDEIVNEDMAVLERHRVSKEMLVQALSEVYEMAQKVFGAEVLIRTGVTAVFHESMGRVPSPFQGDGVFEKGEVVLKDLQGGEGIIITRLGIHLIEKHGFFQGKGSPYRIDPAAAMSLLQLESNTSE
jgi:hypothetical protein